jgi:ABC-2 type transport system ATP-binding protein
MKPDTTRLDGPPDRSSETTPAIRVRDLVKRYPGRPPVEAVRGLSLTVCQGECFGLLGPNGAGKTTTIEILEGLLTPTSGSVEVLGLSWARDEGRLRELIGVSLQETRLSEKLSLLETVRLFRSFYSSGIEPLAALELVGLVHKAAARVSDVSGGERQRLAVATAVVGWPRLLFLDEPTTGLDPQSRRQIWSLVEMFRGCGHTVMLTTHFMDEAERLCDRLAIVDAGRIIAEGTPAELLAEFGVAHLDDVFVKLAGRRLSESGWTEPVGPGNGDGVGADAEADR